MPSGAGVIEYRGKRGTVYRVKYADADGRQVMETLGPEREGWTRKKAEAELRERLVRVERGGYRRPGPLTFADYADRWFTEAEAKRRWKPKTVSQYRSVKVRLVKTFGPMPLAAIRPRHVAEFVAARSRKSGASSVNRDIDVLGALFGTALREELVERNPAARAERPKRPPFRPAILEPHEVGLVARAFTDEQWRLVFLTLCLTGLRREELRALRWRDVDLVEKTLRVRDSKSEDGIRSIAISPMLAESLWQHLRTTAYSGVDELVFANQGHGGAVNPDRFRDAFRAALTAAGVEKTLRPFHDLRHTSLTNDAAAGSSPFAVMTKAGHSDMRTTKRYLHLAGVVFRDEADALERRLLGQVESSTHLSEPERIEHDSNALNSAERTREDQTLEM